MPAGVCADCGSDRWKLHRHHVIPKSQGGADDDSNVVHICSNCQAKFYDQCVDCGTTERRHESHGLCGSCRSNHRSGNSFDAKGAPADTD